MKKSLRSIFSKLALTKFSKFQERSLLSLYLGVRVAVWHKKTIVFLYLAVFETRFTRFLKSEKKLRKVEEKKS